MIDPSRRGTAVCAWFIGKLAFMSQEKMPWLSRLTESAGGPGGLGPTMSDVYEFGSPSHQNAIDLLPGWNHAFPKEMNLSAGPGYMYEDPRIHWAVAQFGSLEGKRIMELGPLEA